MHSLSPSFVCQQSHGMLRIHGILVWDCIMETVYVIEITYDRITFMEIQQHLGGRVIVIPIGNHKSTSNRRARCARTRQ